MFGGWTNLKTNAYGAIGIIIIFPMLAFVQFLSFLRFGNSLHCFVSIGAIAVTFMYIGLYVVDPESPIRYQSGFWYRTSRPMDGWHRVLDF